MRQIITLLALCFSIISMAQDKNSVTTTLFEASITCDNCKAKIMKQMPYEKGVKNVEVDVENKQVSVSYKTVKNSDEQLKSALEKLGYTVAILGEPSSFIVKGNCDMCKKRIEKAALELKGVSMANWSKDTQELSVLFNSSMVNLKDVYEKMAEVGHDTKTIKAKDSIYATLPECCKYDR